MTRRTDTLEQGAARTHDFAQEHEVLKRILETLQPFDQDTRRRIMEAVITFFGVRDGR